MTSEVAFFEFTRLVNRNATNNNINVDRGRFVLSFNDIQNRYLQWSLDHRNEDSIRIVQKVLIKEAPLTLDYTYETHATYRLAANYFEHANLKVVASKDCCKDRNPRTFEVKSENTEDIWPDEFNKPSFEWEETFYYLTNDKVSVARDEFTIDSVSHTYYRYPVQIDVTGYTNLSGVASTNIDPEWDDKVVNRILLAMATDFAATNNDPNKYQLDKDRLFTGI